MSNSDSYNRRVSDGAVAVEAANNAGRILTSTLWNQSGTVYVSVKGVQTAQNGYSYNQYCPNAGGRTLTGCSNTADSQILYYWMEKGYRFSLSVTDQDFFYLGSNKSQKRYLSETPGCGEGSISQINSLLASADAVGNGDFIAALNFYCGAKNNSVYGTDATSTSYQITVSTDGGNSKAFRSAGFDSYYSIVAKSSAPEAKIFFSNGKLTDTAYSILRENLDYGEIIRVGIPGHAIYMDGYRYNTTLKEYEYHLNYGWGVYASATDWYAAGELDELDLSYLTIDLSPKIAVNVTSARSDYYGGSFLRGMERINHIVNTRTTTFSFDNSIAGQSIRLSTASTVTSNVSLNFTNLNAALSTTAESLISSAQGMSFTVNSGSMTVNSANAAFVVKGTGSGAVSVTLDSSYMYCGNYTAGTEALNTLLHNTAGYSYSALGNSFFATVSGSAVVSGAAADTVSLTNGSAVFGDLSLGAGRNVLNVENGSLFFGSFTGAKNTLNANFTIRSSEWTTPMVVLKNKASDSAFFSATGGVLHVDFRSSASQDAVYDLYWGTDASVVQGFTLNVTSETGTYVLDSSHRSAGDFFYSCDGTRLSLGYSPVVPTVRKVYASVTTPTNKPVTVKAEFSQETTSARYSLDGVNWKTYTSAGVVLKSNAVVRFQAFNRDKASAVVSYKVSWIDAKAPDAPKVTANITAATQKNVTLSAVFAKDAAVNQYRIDSGEWKNCTGKVTLKNNATVRFRSIDAAGNTSATTSYKVTNIDRTPPKQPTVKLKDPSPTVGTTVLEVAFSADSAKKQYSLDNKTWKSCGSTLSVKANGKYYFRSADAAGNVSKTAVFTVGNLLKTSYSLPGKSVAAGKSCSIRASVETGGRYKIDGNFGVLTGTLTLKVGGKKAASGTVKRGTLTLDGGGLLTLNPDDVCTAVIKNTGKFLASVDTLSLTAVNLFPLENKDNTFAEAQDAGTIKKTGRALVSAGWVGVGDKKDFHRFTLQSSASLNLTFTADDTMKFTIYSSGKKALKSFSLQTSAGKSVSLSTGNLLLKAGSYYLLAESSAKKNAYGDYSVTVNTASKLFPAGDNTNDSREAASKQTAVLVGKKISGWVGYGDAKDFIKMQVKKQGRVSLDLNSTTAKALSAGKIKLSLLDSSGKSVKLASVDKDTVASKAAVAKGTYYLGVACTDVKKYETGYSITTGLLATV